MKTKLIGDVETSLNALRAKMEYFDTPAILSNGYDETDAKDLSNKYNVAFKAFKALEDHFVNLERRENNPTFKDKLKNAKNKLNPLLDLKTLKTSREAAKNRFVAQKHAFDAFHETVQAIVNAALS